MRSDAGGPGWTMLRILPCLLLGKIKQPARFQLIANQALGYLAVAGFRQSVPEEKAFRHFVARNFRREEGRNLSFAHRLRTLARDANRYADLAPKGIRHAKHGDLTDSRMCEDFLLHLARVDVGAAGYIHVRCATSYIHKAFLIHVAEIARAKPAFAECFRVRLRIIVIAGEHAGPNDADLAGLERF